MEKVIFLVDNVGHAQIMYDQQKVNKFSKREWSLPLFYWTL